MRTAIISHLQQPPGFDLAFRLRLPPSGQARRCLILLHGVGGNETNLLHFADTVDDDTLLVWVRGPLALSDSQFAWFQVQFTATGPSINPEHAEYSRLALIEFVTQIQQLYQVAAQHTVIAGFSQGGIVSASVALSAPERVAAFAILSGRILPELTPQIADKQRLAGLQGYIAHGRNDSKLPLFWAERADELLKTLGVEHQLRLYPIDHEISDPMQADFIDWLHHVGRRLH